MTKKVAAKREKSVQEFRAEVLSKGPLNGTNSSNAAVSEKINEYNKIVKSRNTELQQQLANAYEIKSMRATGEFSEQQIQEAKKKLGMEPEGGTQAIDTTSSVNQMMMMKIAEIEDPEKAAQILQTMSMVETMTKAKTDPAMQISVMKMLQGKGSTGSKDNEKDFMTEMMKKMMDNVMNPKSELDNLTKLQTLLKTSLEMQPKNEPLKETLETIKELKEAGLIGDKKDGIETMKLEVDKLRVDKEYEIKKEEILADKARTESIGTIAGDLVSSAFSAIGASTGSSKKSEVPKDRYIRDTLEAACLGKGCGGKILVTNSAETRNIVCPKCGSNYQYDANQKKLFLLGEESSGPPVKETPGQQSPPPQQQTPPTSPGISDHPIV